jgi:hypothetical protein
MESNSAVSGMGPSPVVAELAALVIKTDALPAPEGRSVLVPRHPVRISRCPARSRVLTLRELATAYLFALCRVRVIDKGSFRYTKGTSVPYASSPAVERTHCGRCGCRSRSRAARSSRYGLARPKVAPTYHCHVAEQLPWIEFADALPRCAHSSKNATPVSHGSPLTSSMKGGASRRVCLASQDACAR